MTFVYTQRYVIIIFDIAQCCNKDNNVYTKKGKKNSLFFLQKKKTQLSSNIIRK